MSELPSGEDLARHTLKLANQSLFNVYPQLIAYTETIEEALSNACLEETLLKKLSSSNREEKLNTALDIGIEATYKILDLIPDQVDLSGLNNKYLWREIMRKNLPPSNSQIMDLPNVKVVASGARLCAQSPESSDLLKIGNRLNKGIVFILMEPVLPDFSKRMTNDSKYVRIGEKDEIFEARKTLRSLDDKDLATNRNKLLEAYLASLIPAHILSSRESPLMDYPR